MDDTTGVSAEGAYRALMAGASAEEAAMGAGVTIADVQQFCGGSDAGHLFEFDDNGHDDHTFYRWSRCVYCNADDERAMGEDL